MQIAVLQRLKINYSMKDKNPINSVSFFHDWNDTEAKKIPQVLWGSTHCTLHSTWPVLPSFAHD